MLWWVHNRRMIPTQPGYFIIYVCVIYALDEAGCSSYHPCQANCSSLVHVSIQCRQLKNIFKSCAYAPHQTKCEHVPAFIFHLFTHPRTPACIRKTFISGYMILAPCEVFFSYSVVLLCSSPVFAESGISNESFYIAHWFYPLSLLFGLMHCSKHFWCRWFFSACVCVRTFTRYMQ